MPMINISISADDYNKLQEEYRKMAIAWPRPGLAALPPTFEEWAGARAASGDGASMEDTGLNDIRVFTAIEKTITSLQAHDFGLAHFGKQETMLSRSARAFAESLVRSLRLSQHQLKRVQELVEYYAKGAKEIADAAHVGVTNRAYGALHEAYRELVERTDKAADRLGEQRAIGRVEGAIAILVSLNVMDREAAQQKTDAFKLQVRNPGKRTG
jgi:hypothetical protein